MNPRAILSGLTSGKTHNFSDTPIAIEWHVLHHQDDLENLKKLPIELQYAIAIHPSRYALIKNILSQGHGFAIGKQKHIPRNIINAVEHIAGTHHGAIYPWLEDLILKQAIPRWSESDLEEAAEMGIDLKEQARNINKHIAGSIQIKLIQSPNNQLSPDIGGLAYTIEKDIQKIYSLEMVNRLLSEHLNRTRDFYFLLLLSICLFAPIVHVLEMLLPGLGKVVALLLPSIYYESLSVSHSYSLGATSWQITDNIKAKWPELLALLVFAILVLPLLSAGLYMLSAVAFALAACSILFGKEFRRLKKARAIYSILSSEGKVSMSSKTVWLKLFYGPLWWVSAASILLSIALSITAFVLVSPLLSNGWLLAVLAISPYVIYEMILLIWHLSLGWRFKLRVKKLLSQAIIS